MNQLNKTIITTRLPHEGAVQRDGLRVLVRRVVGGRRARRPRPRARARARLCGSYQCNMD